MNDCLVGSKGSVSFTALLEFGMIIGSYKLAQPPTTSISGGIWKLSFVYLLYSVDPTNTVAQNTLPIQLSPKITLLQEYGLLVQLHFVTSNFP